MEFLKSGKILYKILNPNKDKSNNQLYIFNKYIRLNEINEINIQHSGKDKMYDGSDNL